jgi:hypothetical protein
VPTCQAYHVLTLSEIISCSFHTTEPKKKPPERATETPNDQKKKTKPNGRIRPRCRWRMTKSRTQTKQIFQAPSTENVDESATREGRESLREAAWSAGMCFAGVGGHLARSSSRGAIAGGAAELRGSTALLERRRGFGLARGSLISWLAASRLRATVSILILRCGGSCRVLVPLHVP